MVNLFGRKTVYFKAASLSHKKTTRKQHPRDYTGNNKFFSEGIKVSIDHRRAFSTTTPVIVPSGEVDGYEEMVFDQEGMFSENADFDIACEDTSADRIPRKPHLVYVCSLCCDLYLVLILVSIKEVPLKAWIPHRDAYLYTLLELDGPGSHLITHCHGCNAAADDLIRCVDCFGGFLYCGACTISNHHATPLHCLEVGLC
jgi:hypothetical protein